MNDGPLGWNVYVGDTDPAFAGFIPAPGLDEKLETIADQLATEIEDAAGS